MTCDFSLMIARIRDIDIRDIEI